MWVYDARCLQENNAPIVIFSIQESSESVTKAVFHTLLVSPEMRHFEEILNIINTLKSSSKQLKNLLIISVVF